MTAQRTPFSLVWSGRSGGGDVRQENKHWSIIGTHICVLTGKDLRVEIANLGPGERAHELGEFIVTACNGWDDVVAALRNISNMPTPSASSTRAERMKEIANAALAKVSQ